MVYKPPVLNIESLPSDSVDGDKRLVISNRTVYVYTSGAWEVETPIDVRKLKILVIPELIDES